MSDPTTPAGPTPEAPVPTPASKSADAPESATETTTEIPPVVAAGAGDKTVEEPAAAAADKPETGFFAEQPEEAPAAEGKKRWWRRSGNHEGTAAATKTAGATKTADAGESVDATKTADAATTAGAGESASAATTAGGATTADAGKSAGAATAAGAGGAAGGTKVAGPAEGDAGKSAGGGAPEVKTKWWRRIRVRGPWVTVGGVVAVLIVLALLGYVWGLGPLNRLNAQRAITPPAKLAGLDKVTDQEIRTQAQLDQTQEALSRINDGKDVTVEAYGSLDGDRFFVLIALRGKVDLDKTVADSGATGDQIKKVGKSTCVETTNLPTQCYLTSSTLTVILQSANEGVTVDQVAPVAEEAFDAMK
ncbi:hypothetical protein AB0L70_27925 [Kribbella sp. NPDC051952]|uniref:hypothetical protein n=1 Tax=Kribbella sp. NPDC051952 TaxID=3154851 RepID=UPI00342658C3